MDLDHNACYRAVKLRDARFDGRFFTAVKTTKIYCRPICPARTPLSKNVLFFPTAAAAQEEGLESLLRCPPHLSGAHTAVEERPLLSTGSRGARGGLQALLPLQA